jgi:hypothetical protein
VRNKREEKKEAERKAGLIERGFGPSDVEASFGEKGKGVGRYDDREGGSNGVGEPVRGDVVNGT